jgi:hypothetical protein
MRDGTAGRPPRSKETSDDNEQRGCDEIAAPQRATAVPLAAFAALDEQHADDISTYALTASTGGQAKEPAPHMPWMEVPHATDGSGGGGSAYCGGP